MAIESSIQQHADDGSQTIQVSDSSCGLEAIIVLDSTVLGPAVGGTRTNRYPTAADAKRDAKMLARAMTRKCAMAGLDAGGGKAVVIDHPGLDRAAAFAALGQFIASLDGRFRTAGDLGTTNQDLQAMAAHCPYVHLNERDLAAAVARGHVACLKQVLGVGSLAGLTASVVGCGTIGTAIAHSLANHRATLVVADVIESRAAQLAAQTGGRHLDVDRAMTLDTDILAPCALGGVINKENVNSIRARVVCGGANNIIKNRITERHLIESGTIWVPDEISSAGAVIEGIGETVMGLSDRGDLIDGLGHRAKQVIERAQHDSLLPSQVIDDLVKKLIMAKLP